MAGIIDNPDNYPLVQDENDVPVQKLNRDIISEMRERNEKKRLKEHGESGLSAAE
jgi:hypothetical protein